jgi:amino acid adenylation domain-containing protein
MAAPPENDSSAPAIAVIGMSGRFPGARSPEEFWQNLIGGVDSVSHFSDAELEVGHATRSQPGYVGARSVLADVDKFDAAFFGIYPKEAEQMDPQHRIFLECAWEALEGAGHAPGSFPGLIGVFAGCSMNTYFMHNLVRDRAYLARFAEGYQSSGYTTMLGNDKDFLPTRVSYKLDLRGPSLSIQTACSTSLVAVAQACQSLLTYGCDMALAGGVSITFPQRRGYVPEEGGILSSDGSIRPFDQNAKGTVFGHGAGVVLLKRLEDAAADRDNVLAVIRGFALNNDGSHRAGYTAPSQQGQAEVILAAQAMAGFAAETISYVEAHGTATALGDPVEVAGLTRAFRASTDKRNFCVLGTAKANIGHLDVASGVVGLIKTVLQMQHRTIPGLLHYTGPNPAIELAHSPFLIQAKTTEWKPAGGVLRAGISSFGVGGTNAHVVLEQAPQLEPSSELPSVDARPQLLLLSAKTPTALAAMQARLADHLAMHPEDSLVDVAYTLQVGRSHFSYRRAVVAADRAGAIVQLQASAPAQTPHGHADGRNLVFLFPGQGTQAVGMGRLLFEQVPVFRETLEAADALVRPMLRDGLIGFMYPPQTASSEVEANAAKRLNQTSVAQPAIFAISYALARVWQSLGVEPAMLIGHSIGEFVAATLAGTLSFEDAMRLVAARGAAVQQLPSGAMLAVRASAETVLPYLSPGLQLDLASINGPKSVVVSGTHEDVETLAARLSGDGIAARKLATSHAFHSRMMEPALDPFSQSLKKASFHAPTLPWISTLTGEPINPEEVTKPAYWIQQLRSPVQFAQAAQRVLTHGYDTFLEVGPGQTLSNLLKQNILTSVGNVTTIASLPISAPGDPEIPAPIELAVGQLWEQGNLIRWEGLWNGSKGRRIPLPTYPFERKSYWVDPPPEIESNEIHPEASPALYAVPLIENVSDGAVPNVSSEAKYMPDAVRSALIQDLKAMVTELSDIDLSQTPSSVSLLELGLDSLFLTQLTQAIRAAYGVKLTFRQIMGQYSSFDALATHLESVAAPEKLPQAAPALVAPAPVVPPQPSLPPPMPATNFAVPQPGAADSYAALFAQQMAAMGALMQRQLEILSGAASAAPIPSVSQAVSQAPVPVPAPLATPEATAPPAKSKAEAAPPTPEKEFGTLVPLRPLDLRAADVLTPKQEQYIESLIRRYNQRTAKSKASAQRFRSVLADPRVASGFNPQFKEVVYPIAVERSKGAYLWDVDGNKYIDILNGYGSIFFGHSPDFVTAAVREQLELGFPIGPQTELAGECAELMTGLVGMDRATFCNTGSEAVMAALRLARTVTGRSLIVLFAGAYHGQIDEVLVKSNRSEKSIPTAPGIPNQSVANMLVLEYGSAHALEVIRRRAEEIAAVLVEPVQSRHPELRPVEFLKEIRSITEQAGAALIFDEVVTGFRTDLGGAQRLFGIRADMATYGKVVAGGMPVGVVAGSRAYMDALDGGAWQYGDASVPQVGVTFFAGTFVRHPLTMAAVRATLRHLRDEGPGLQAKLAATNTALVTDLNAMFEEFGFPAHIQHFASWFFFAVPPEARLAKLLYYHLREKGLHLQEGFPCFLTTAHTAADLQTVRDTFRQVLTEMRDHEIIGHAGETTPPKPPAETAVTPLEAPITEAQREVLLASQLGPESSCAFNESVSLHLSGLLDRGCLKKALEQVVARHEALRLAVGTDGETIVVAPQVPVTIVEEDWRSRSVDDQAREMHALLQAEAATAFDLKQAPLFRCTLVQLGDDRSVLVFTGHHIIVDGWSINVVFEELGKIYSALKAHTAPQLLPVHSFLEQARTESREPNAETEAFWLEQFRTLPPPLELPVDRPRGALRSHSGSTFKRTLPAELVAKLRAASARSGNTLFSTLLSGYALLLSRLTRQEDIVVGIPMAGQRNFGGESFVGHSVNFLPIRVDVSRETTFTELADQIKNKVYDALDHQDYTLGTLVRKLNIPRNPARLELVEAQFNLEQVGGSVHLDGLTTRLEANPKAAVNADIFFNFVDRGELLAVECDYNTSLFDESTLDRWVSSLASLLNDAADDFDKPAAALRWVTDDALKQLVVDWNQTRTEYPAHLPVHVVFEQQAAKTPQATALRYGTQAMTYAQLNEQANRFAHFLRRELTPGEQLRVALSLDRSPELMVAILGTLKAGGVYVPIDPAYPAARIAMLLEDSDPSLLLTQQSMLDNFPTTIRTYTVEELESVLPTQSGENLDAEVGAQNPAYIIYTSGSTGRPKGVVVPHRAITRLVLGSDFIRFASDEVFLQLAPVSFDASTLEIWGALLNGATLALIAGNKPSPEEIGDAIQTYGVTTMWLTAALFHLMVMDHLPRLAPLQQLLAGGDVLSISHVRKVLEAIPHLRLVNGYGPTENTTFTCCHAITLDSLAGGSVPIGRPISNTRIYILDDHGAPVPVGVPGNLHAAGDGLALGYWRAPELTAEKFIELDLPLAGRERLYRTGDTARYRADGIVEFQGRTDNQVKIRGFRVELGEIEAAAERFPGVRAAIVAARPDWTSPMDIPGDKRLAMYVLLDNIDAAAFAGGFKDQLRNFLREQLPDHMQPAAILQVAEFPRTANGKVDYRALPAPDAERVGKNREIVEPRTAIEGQLASIWCNVLKLDSVSIHDSIFELGGDSLSIFRITTQANQAGIPMTAKHLFQYKSIAALSPKLEEDQASPREQTPLRQTIRAVSREQFRKVQNLTKVEQ